MSYVKGCANGLLATGAEGQDTSAQHRALDPEPSGTKAEKGLHQVIAQWERVDTNTDDTYELQKRIFFSPRKHTLKYLGRRANICN